VSAVTASSTTVGSVPMDPVRALQHTLYRAAKADPGRRFHALRDKIFRRDVLWRAWATVRRNDGAPGIDRVTLGAVEEYEIVLGARSERAPRLHGFWDRRDAGPGLLSAAPAH
jgi:RNA-directed DNA polymerase